jgi:hypothetical protein
MSGTTFTWVGGQDVNGANNWVTPTNWTAGGVAATAFPNDSSATAIVNTDNGSADAIISNGQTISLASLSIGNPTTPATGVVGGHVLVGGSAAIGGGGGGTLTVAGAITITSTNTGGAIVGGKNGVINAPTMTINGGPDVLVGGGGIFNVTNIVNNGDILADGGFFDLGPLVLNAGTISGTGILQVAGPSTLEINAPTSQQVQVLPTLGQTSTVIFDQPSAFKGSIDIQNANGNFGVNLFFKGETPTAVTFDQDTHTLVVTGAGGVVLNTIPFTSNGTLPLAITASTLSGYGEVTIGATVTTDTTAPAVPSAPDLVASSDSGVSDTDNITRVTTPTFTGTAEANATVTLFDGTTIIGTGKANASGVWSIASSTLADGVHSITATATDLAGNTSAPSAALAVTIDTTAPSSGIVPGIPTPDPNGISTTTLTSTDLAQVLQGDQSALRFVAGTQAIVLVDGRLSVGPDTDEAYVERLYRSTLNRDADQDGLSFWSAALKSVGKAAVAQGFINSTEYQTAHPGQDITSFARGLYEAFLGRPAEDAGLAFWTQSLAAGTPRGEAAVLFADSAEAKQHWAAQTSRGMFAYDLQASAVRENYLAALGREADSGGLAFWTNFLKNGATTADLARTLAQSAEFKALHDGQSDQQFIQSVYTNGLGRAADPDGLNFWTGALGAGAVRSDIVAAIANSPEGQLHPQWALT